jgi:hypothetical protein
MPAGHKRLKRKEMDAPMDPECCKSSVQKEIAEAKKERKWPGTN